MCDCYSFTPTGLNKYTLTEMAQQQVRDAMKNISLNPTKHRTILLYHSQHTDNLEAFFFSLAPTCDDSLVIIEINDLANEQNSDSHHNIVKKQILK